jgi:predicted nucleic acid-binding protein
MEAASLGVILDSSLAIDAERQHLNAVQFLKQIVAKIGETEVGSSAITVAELAHGVYRANSPERRERRRGFLDDLKAGRAGIRNHGCYGGIGRQDWG